MFKVQFINFSLNTINNTSTVSKTLKMISGMIFFFIKFSDGSNIKDHDTATEVHGR